MATLLRGSKYLSRRKRGSVAGKIRCLQTQADKISNRQIDASLDRMFGKSVRWNYGQGNYKSKPGVKNETL